MLGTYDGKSYVVDRLVWPDLLADNANEDTVFVRPEWWSNAAETAKAHGLQVIGDIHSHCYGQPVDDHAPSQSDWDRLDREFIQGICVVTETKAGKKRASLKFWATPPNVTLKVSA